MKNECRPFGEWIKHYEEKARSEPINWLVGCYVHIIKKPESKSLFIEKAMEQAYRNVLNTRGDEIVSHHWDLMVRWEKKPDSKLGRKISFLERFLWEDQLRERPYYPDIYQLGEMLYDLLKEYIIAERTKLEPWTSRISEEFNLNSDLDYYRQTIGERGVKGNGLVEKVTTEILSRYHDLFFGSIPWDKFQSGFEEYVLSQPIKQEI